MSAAGLLRPIITDEAAINPVDVAYAERLITQYSDFYTFSDVFHATGIWLTFGKYRCCWWYNEPAAAVGKYDEPYEPFPLYRFLFSHGRKVWCYILQELYAVNTFPSYVVVLVLQPSRNRSKVKRIIVCVKSSRNHSLLKVLIDSAFESRILTGKWARAVRLENSKQNIYGRGVVCTAEDIMWCTSVYQRPQ